MLSIFNERTRANLSHSVSKFIISLLQLNEPWKIANCACLCLPPSLHAISCLLIPHESAKSPEKKSGCFPTEVFLTAEVKLLHSGRWEAPLPSLSCGLNIV